MPTKGYITVAAKVDKETHDLLVEKASERGTSVNKLLGDIVRGYISEGYVNKEGFSLDEHIATLNLTEGAKEALKHKIARSLKQFGRKES